MQNKTSNQKVPLQKMSAPIWCLLPPAGLNMVVFIIVLFKSMFKMSSCILFARFMHQAHMETTVLHLLMLIRRFTLQTGTLMLLLTRTSIRVSSCTFLSLSTEVWGFWGGESGVTNQTIATLCRWICCSWSEPRHRSGTTARPRRRRSSGHARWSSNWFGSRLPLLGLLTS